MGLASRSISRRQAFKWLGGAIFGGMHAGVYPRGGLVCRQRRLRPILSTGRRTGDRALLPVWSGRYERGAVWHHLLWPGGRAARTEYVFKVGVQRALLVAPEVGLGDLCVAGRRSYAHLEGA